MGQATDCFKIQHNNLNPKKGQILISTPFLQDLYFQRSVVLLTEHDTNGSMGFVLNKRTNFFISDFFPELNDSSLIPIYLGGPVSSDRLFFIHSLGDIPNSVEIGYNLFFDGDFDALKEYIMDDNSNLSKIKFFLGYSGWTKDQLDDEIIKDSWLVSNSRPQKMISAYDDGFWNYSIEQMGAPYATWTNYPKNPIHN